MAKLPVSASGQLRAWAAELEKEERELPKTERALHERIANLKTELDRERAKVDAWEERGKVRVKMINDLEDKLSQARDSLERASSETKAALERADDHEKRATGDVEVGKKTIGTLQEMVRRLEADRLQLKRELSDLSKDRQEFRAKAIAGKLGIEGPPRMCVGAVIVGPRGVVLGRRLQRDCGHDKMILPGGGMEGVESIEEGLAREVLEETGLKIGAERRFVMAYRHVSAPWLNNVILWYVVESIDPVMTPRAGDDLGEPAYYTRAQIGEIHKEGRLSRIAGRVLAKAMGWTELDS